MVLRRFEHPQHQELLDKAQDQPTSKDSPEYAARKACALCCLCGLGSRCLAENRSRAWLAVERRQAAAPDAAQAAVAATAGPGPGPAATQGLPVTYHVGSWELGPAPFHKLWLDMLSRHAGVMGKLEDQTDMRCHRTCCMQHSRDFAQQAARAAEQAAGSHAGLQLSQSSQPSQPSQPPITQPGSVIRSGVPDWQAQPGVTTRRAAELQEENRMLLSDRKRKELQVAQLQERQRELEESVLQKSEERRRVAEAAEKDAATAASLKLELMEQLRARLGEGSGGHQEMHTSGAVVVGCGTLLLLCMHALAHMLRGMHAMLSLALWVVVCPEMLHCMCMFACACTCMACCLPLCRVLQGVTSMAV